MMMLVNVLERTGEKAKAVYFLIVAKRAATSQCVVYFNCVVVVVVVVVVFGSGRNATMFIVSHKMWWFRSSR